MQLWIGCCLGVMPTSATVRSVVHLYFHIYVSYLCYSTNYKISKQIRNWPCMYMKDCVFVFHACSVVMCLYMGDYVVMYIYIYTSLPISTYLYTYISTHPPIYTYPHIHIYIYINPPIFIPIYLPIYTYPPIFTHIYTHI